MNGQEPSRPTTPVSLMTSSFHDATSTFDDLTAAIADLSRIPSPEPVVALTCCCGKEDCGNFRSWLELKAKLNRRLVLSAEVGQALLQRHEAYVRKTEQKVHDEPEQSAGNEEINRLQLANENLQRECDALVQENAKLEKRLNEAIVNTEVTEVSNKTILQELQEARDSISRLTAHHARSIGWETRLSAAQREREDMQQERDEEMHRARLAESRFAVLKDKTAKLQAEVRRLQENLEEKRLHRLESSETLIQDARTRLQSFRNSQLGLTAKLAEEELTSVLESVVHDNEVLKHDNADLQHLLAEAREEIHSLQEELEEQRANPPSGISRSGGNSPIPRHHHTGSVSSIGPKDFMLLSPPGRPNSSAGGKSKRWPRPPSISLRFSSSQDPTTLDSNRSPMDPDSLTPSKSKRASFGQLSQDSHVSMELDENAEQESDSTLYEKHRAHRPLLLLARSRGVQTEGIHTQSLPPTHLSPSYPRSETSSVSESQPSHMASILERVIALFNRIAQADALTLTNRLKRQHLQGADVGHLSRTTISSILADATGLRTHFRFLLEDEKTSTTCSRKDLRVFFKFIKDIFTELGELRVAMNDVILDPSSAVRLSELSMKPGQAQADNGRENGMQSGPAAWMAPISKLFLPSAIAKSDSGGSTDRLTPSSSTRTGIGGLVTSRPPKFVPKLGPALAASATTVNVEFSGTGVGRAVTSTVRLQPTVNTSETPLSTMDSGSSGLMGIFAGAQKAVEPTDPWVVLPLPKKPSKALAVNNESGVVGGLPTATIGRSALRKPGKRLSRNVDAVIDIVDEPRGPEDQEEEQDYIPPLMQKTLRRRGLSDSSIHSTFTNHGAEQGLDMQPSPQKSASPASRMPAWRDPNAMFQAFRWGMFNLGHSASPRDSDAGVVAKDTSPSRQTSSNESQGSMTVTTTSGTPSLSDIPAVSATPVVPSPSLTPVKKVAQSHPVEVASPNRGGVLPSLASWATSSMIMDPVSGSDPFLPSSLREETYMRRPTRRSARSGSKDETHFREFY